MGAENEVPFLLEVMFGEAAGVARLTASERLLRWCQAMDEWLAERQRLNHASTFRTSKVAWRKLLSQCGKPPWEIELADMEAYIERMEEQDYAVNTIKFEMTCLSSFYRWCSQHNIDPACGDDFNPAAVVQRPKASPYTTANVLSSSEVRRLLSFIERDTSLLGRRDYAFFLARLSMGVKLKSLQQLQWGQIDQDDEGARVCWRPNGKPVRLPAAVWEAVKAYLELSGRLVGIQPKDYVFVPLRDPLRREACGEAADWRPGRYLTSDRIKGNLKLYGRLAGITDEKLRLPVLRHTAVAVRLEAGDSWEEMREFLDSKATPEKMKAYLRQVPQLPREEPSSGEDVQTLIELPERKRHIRKPGDGIIHGKFTQAHPIAEVLAVIAENIQGMDDEIEGLRDLGRALVAVQMKTETGALAAELGNAYTQAADRLRVLNQTADLLDARDEDGEWLEEMLLVLDNLAEGGDGLLPSEELKQRAAQGGGGRRAGKRGLTEEIATTRWVMRNFYSLAIDAEDVKERVRYTNDYGRGCVQLARMLKSEKSAQGQEADILREIIEETILEVNAEWGLDLGGGDRR